MKHQFLAIAAVLTGCASTPPAQRVEIVWNGEACDARIGGHTARIFSTKDDHRPEALAEELKRLLPDTHAPVVLVGDENIPYRCIGQLVFEMQRTGHRRLDTSGFFPKSGTP